jgi:hypothetical protein
MYSNDSRITLAQAELLAAETRHILGLAPPMPIKATSAYARVIPAHPTATGERTEGAETLTEAQLYAKLTYSQRAKLKTQDPKVYTALKAANQAQREELTAKLWQTKAMADRATIRAELAKLL